MIPFIYFIILHMPQTKAALGSHTNANDLYIDCKNNRQRKHKRTYKHSKQNPDRVLLTHSRAQEGPSGASCSNQGSGNIDERTENNVGGGVVCVSGGEGG